MIATADPIIALCDQTIAAIWRRSTPATRAADVAELIRCYRMKDAQVAILTDTQEAGRASD